MVTKSKKKTTIKKNAKPMVKKDVVKTAPVADVKATAVVKTTDVKKATPKKVYEISAFFHSIIVVMVVLLYAELTFLGVLYFNYEVTIESKESIQARQYRVQYQQKMQAERWKAARVRQAKMRRVERSQARPAIKCPAPVERKAAFVEAEYAPYAEAGNAVIVGNACFVLADGSEKCFEGVDVFINPVTAYSNEWYERGWAGREYLSPADARAVKFNKTVKTGKNGAFEFKDLKAGAYYVGTAVCLPEAKDSKQCRLARFAAKVKMKNKVKPTLQKVFP